MRKSVRLKLLDTLVRAASKCLIAAGAAGALLVSIGGWWPWFPLCLIVIAVGMGLFAWPYENEEVDID